MNKKTNYAVKIRLESNDYKVLDQSVSKLAQIIKNENVELLGPIPLPTKAIDFAVRRAPSIYKNSFEKFSYRVHTRLMFINNIESVDRLKFIGQVVIPQIIKIKVSFIKS